MTHLAPNDAAVLIDARAQGSGAGRVAIISGDERVTYGELGESVDRVGSALRELGVRRGERVMLLLCDGPDFAAAFFGAIKIGAVAVPVSGLLPPEDYRFLLEDSGAAALVVDAELLPRVERSLAGSASLRHVLVAGLPPGEPPGAGPPPGRRSLARLREEASGTLEPAQVGREDAAFCLYSSGTTGRPKAAIHRHGHMPASADGYARGVLGLGPEDVCFSAAKLHFAYGLGNGLHFPLRVGAAAVHLRSRPTADAVLETLERRRPTVFFSVPTSFSQILSRAEERGLERLWDVRLAVSAGEHLPPVLLGRWRERFGIEILDGIGSTEALHIFISNFPGDIVPGSTGRLVPGYAARIVDPEGRDLPPGETGDLLVRGPSTLPGYWNRPEETRRTVLGEWIRTGDQFHCDGAGRYWFHGRGDDLLKVSGRWVSPSEVEAALLEHPLVREAAVVGREDADGLVKPLACVVLREAGPPPGDLSERLAEFLAPRLPSFKRPRWYRTVGELPRTATGKLQRYKLRENGRGQEKSEVTDGR